MKMIEISKPGLSMKKKRYVISLNLIQYLEEVLSFKKIRMCCSCAESGFTVLRKGRIDAERRKC